MPNETAGQFDEHLADRLMRRMDKEDSTKRWVFPREISIGDVVAIITGIVAALVSYFNLKGLVDIHTSQISAIAVEQVRQDKTTDDLRLDVVDRLKEIQQDLRELRGARK